MTLKSEETGILQVLDENNKDFSSELNITSLNIEMGLKKTIAIVSTINPKFDIKIDEVEINFDIKEYLRMRPPEELLEFKLEIERLLSE